MRERDGEREREREQSAAIGMQFSRNTTQTGRASELENPAKSFPFPCKEPESWRRDLFWVTGHFRSREELWISVLWCPYL